ncbi:hypothetical protein PVAG01_10022 [Phlyctema vagabunda]|uniref:Uncharacterized protein n=1 Tax=Phlyctema vagabunda TaxID=108571 RepID=A0ABR4P4S2_9HELO
MRGLGRATLLLAPTLVSTLAVPSPSQSWDDDRDVDQSFASFIVDPRQSRSPDDWSARPLNFRLDVRPSVEACGYGNVTLDGQVLPQTKEDGVWAGKGPVNIGGKSIVVASWVFSCNKVDDVPSSQLLKFKVEFLDGKPLADVGFTALFRQHERTEIIKIGKTLSLPSKSEHSHHDGLTTDDGPHGPHGPSHNDEGKRPHGRPQSFEDDMRELHWMRSQMRELEWMIFEKEQALFEKSLNHQDEDIRKCDSLKCVLRTTMAKAKGAVDHAVGRLTGSDEFIRDFHGRAHAPPSDIGKEHHGKHGNHTHGAPGSNSTRPHPPHHFLPICRFPPPRNWPPHHPGKGPHHGPPGPPRPHGKGPGSHHGPPDHDFQPDWEEHDHYRGPPGPPPNWGQEDHRRPHSPPGPPPNWGDHESHRGPPGPPPFHHGGPEFDDEPSSPFHQGNPGDQPGRRPPQLEPEQRRPMEQDQHHGPPHDDHEMHSWADDEQEHPEVHEDDRHHHDGPPPPGHGPDGGFEGPSPRPPPPGPKHGPGGGPLPPPGHHRSRLMMTLHIFKWTVVGFLASILLAALHKRTCSSSKSAEHHARREKRELRRAYRRHVHKTAINRLMARMTGDDSDFDDGEEKYRSEGQQLMHDAEDGMSTTISEEIVQFQNAASVVGQMVDAPQRPPSITISQHDGTSPPHILSDDLYSEELPAYEDNDGSEASSFIADGFRYTPGSSDYSPAQSSNGSVSDILGVDTKQ